MLNTDFHSETAFKIDFRKGVINKQNIFANNEKNADVYNNFLYCNEMLNILVLRIWHLKHPVGKER